MLHYVYADSAHGFRKNIKEWLCIIIMSVQVLRIFEYRAACSNVEVLKTVQWHGHAAKQLNYCLYDFILSYT